jgi:hypothetical protein
MIYPLKRDLFRLEKVSRRYDLKSSWSSNFDVISNIFYRENVLDVDCQTQGRLKVMIELYVSHESVINSL